MCALFFSPQATLCLQTRAVALCGRGCVPRRRRGGVVGHRGQGRAQGERARAGRGLASFRGVDGFWAVENAAGTSCLIRTLPQSNCDKEALALFTHTHTRTRAQRGPLCPRSLLRICSRTPPFWRRFSLLETIRTLSLSRSERAGGVARGPNARRRAQSSVMEREEREREKEREREFENGSSLCSRRPSSSSSPSSNRWREGDSC